MPTCTLKFELSSYWHIGSGLGSDAIADAVVVRDVDQLPVLPGRTIKGLLRDAMELAALSGRVPGERIQKWFGSPVAVAAGRSEALSYNSAATSGHDEGDEHESRLEQGRFSSHEGTLWFGSARLPQAWRDWARARMNATTSTSVEEARENDEILNALFTFLASTAIDSRGVALEHSLRVTEVAVPMTLYAEVRGPSDDRQWIDDLRKCLPLLRALGSRRSRGLGRVDVSLEEGK